MAIINLSGGVVQKGGGVTQLFQRKMGGSVNFLYSGRGGQSTFDIKYFPQDNYFTITNIFPIFWLASLATVYMTGLFSNYIMFAQ